MEIRYPDTEASLFQDIFMADADAADCFTSATGFGVGVAVGFGVGFGVAVGTGVAVGFGAFFSSSL